MEFNIVAKIRTDFPGKFGIPRQSSVVQKLKGRIVLEPDYRREGILRGIEGFSHLWLIWVFSENLDENGDARWSPTVRPPRLGGNERMGVFATRSPFRPNPIGISTVRLLGVDYDCPEGPVLLVEGADMVDGTPILDIKPYVPFNDIIEDASGGFTDEVKYELLNVSIGKKGICPAGIMEESYLPEYLQETIDDSIRQLIKCFQEMNANTRETLVSILENDPRPHYQHSAERIYRFEYAGYRIGFTVEDRDLIIVDLQVL